MAGVRERVSGRFDAAREAVGPYALNPLTLGLALARGHHVHRTDGRRVEFGVTGLWEATSILHTYRKEGDVLRMLAGDLDDDAVLYDVGANLGVFTCHAGVGLSGGEVVAFEPHPANVERLTANVERNDVDARVVERALSDAAGTAELTVELGRFGNQRHALATGDGGSTISVETVVGDDLVEGGEVPPPTVVKIDVEGAELRVIEGLAETLAREECRVVYCETHPELLAERGESRAAVRDRLEAAGFAVEAIHSKGGQLYLRGER